MISDDALRAMCWALLGSREGEEEKLLDQIATELINRKLLNPNESLEAQNEFIRLFARAFTTSER
jgi:hypothetical protein